jgi:hypothetical protein
MQRSSKTQDKQPSSRKQQQAATSGNRQHDALDMKRSARKPFKLASSLDTLNFALLVLTK